MSASTFIASRAVPVQVRLPEDLDVRVEEMLLEMRRHAGVRISKTDLIGALLHDATLDLDEVGSGRLLGLVDTWREAKRETA